MILSYDIYGHQLVEVFLEHGQYHHVPVLVPSQPHHGYSSTSPNTCLARLVYLILEKKEQRVAMYLMLLASMVYWLNKEQAMLARAASSM